MAFGSALPFEPFYSLSCFALPSFTSTELKRVTILEPSFLLRPGAGYGHVLDGDPWRLAVGGLCNATVIKHRRRNDRRFV